MYIPSNFRVEDPATLDAFVAENPFATLTSMLRGELFATHIPLLLVREHGQPVLYGHMARANPHWRAFDGAAQALAVFLGAHGYVSASWYEEAPSVPTWNYAAVHACGRPRVIDDAAALSDLMARQAAAFEGGGARAAWKYEGLPEDYRQERERHIVGLRMPVERLEGKFKLSQNRAPGDRQRVMEALRETGRHGDLALAEEMKARVPAGS
ncbi:FMN-binding negative transcriptional regulator [Sorangium sp. So ce1036]|uniref:FMN-binding negative transcriptional regulator n=1 Tax=Sorangium sp. So ce1036 TaxID=3133328 RepID=UPI003F117C94